MGKFYPGCYLAAKETATQLGKLGFHLKRAGISIAVEPLDVAVTNALLTTKLNPNYDPKTDPTMMTTIPHYFINLSPTKTKNSLPAYCARTITSPHFPRLGVPNDPGPIIRELGASVKINFIDEPPYCIYPKNAKETNLPEHIILKGISAKFNKGENWTNFDFNVGILAGIGKNTQEIVDKVFGPDNKLKIENVLHGSTVINLARIAISLLNWGMRNPEKSLFFVSTARLTNDQGSIPQAYLLNKLFNKLGWNPEWLGLAVIRSLAERKHPTGAMLVEIKPEQYKEAFKKVRIKFNQAVKKMLQENSGLF